VILELGYYSVCNINWLLQQLVPVTAVINFHLCIIVHYFVVINIHIAI